MRRSCGVLGIMCVLVVATVLSVGCSKKPPVTVPSTQTSSGEASGSLAPTSDISPPTKEIAGPITSPPAGSVARTALMNAARAKLNTTSQFVVYQLYVQGSYALADIETESGGKRQFVSFKGPEWQAEWVAPFGSASASAADAKGQVPGLTDALLAKIDWKFPKPVSNAAMVSSLSTAAKKWSKTLMDGLGEPYQVTLVKVAQDTGGVWWGRAIVQPSSSATSSFESIEYWCTYSGGAWTGKAQDPEPPAPTTYFPPSVVGSLGF
jgi:hypothetical protein